MGIQVRDTISIDKDLLGQTKGKTIKAYTQSRQYNTTMEIRCF